MLSLDIKAKYFHETWFESIQVQTTKRSSQLAHLHNGFPSHQDWNITNQISISLGLHQSLALGLNKFQYN